ncbi:DUF5000 domain-containing lipoprotein [Sphingobacterium chuzhouense]|uniref:DUF4959 domain-containing protein n=1 Tax=Sphingobacterium chuzhouense TaxID=1742264 RepID=A0ABR7XUP7_9SPHI|nr:DUF5000 domain-containing lipoprotein [Sphingobacterium chuzhouense]MBD1422782.1 DUF4959 domain-containing protein [Sphingobacterium chuzhouense]
MKNIKFLVIISILLVYSCEQKQNEPLVDSFGPPAEVRNVKVENLPGAARLTYTLPSDPGMSYVAAEFTDDRGLRKVVKSSGFKNYVLLEGFGKARDYDVEVYSVSKSEQRSAPVKVNISPTTPPIQLSANTVEATHTFGGVLLNFKNEFKLDYVFYTLIKDEDGRWTEYDRYYSGAETENILFAVRGLEATPTEFAFYLQDKWQNRSDTLYHTLTPLYEEELNKDLWKDAALMDDFNEPLYSPLYQLWTPGERTYFFQNARDYPEKAGMPTWVTIDLGREYLLGRMKTHMVRHANTWKYGSCSPRRFEVWGSNEATTNWDNWTLLGEFESTRPSGRGVGEPLTDDDEKQLVDGEDFEFDLTDQSYRYIRYKVNETWGNTLNFCLLEITLWGQAVN